MPTPSFATSTPRSRYVGVLHASFIVCGGSMGSWLLCLPVVVALREGTRNALTVVVRSWLDLYLACVVVWKRFCPGIPPLLLSYLSAARRTDTTIGVQTTTVGLGPTIVSDSLCLSLSLSVSLSAPVMLSFLGLCACGFRTAAICICSWIFAPEGT